MLGCECQQWPQARLSRSMALPQDEPDFYSQPIIERAQERPLINILAALPLFLTSREVAQIDQFLQETAAREANAKVRLQQFIEELLDRADRAEKQLQIISSCGTTPNGSLGRCSLQASKGNGHQVGAPSSACSYNQNQKHHVLSSDTRKPAVRVTYNQTDSRGTFFLRELFSLARSWISVCCQPYNTDIISCPITDFFLRLLFLFMHSPWVQ